MNNKEKMALIDKAFHENYSIVIEQLEAVDAYISYEDAMAYRRKHEWRLWGFIDAMEAVPTYGNELKYTEIKSYYRKRFKAMFACYF